MPLTTTVGKYATYDSSYLDDEVKGIAMLVEPNLTTSWDLLAELEPSMTTTIKWYDALSNSLEGEVGTGGWTDGTTTSALPIDATLAAVVNIGDMLKVEDEYVIVSAVDRGTPTIDVFARGHGGSTGVAHTAATAIHIVASAHVEGTVDGDGILEDNVEKVNYMQLIEEPVELTLTARNQRYQDVEDKMDEVRARAMSRALRKLNLSALLGVPSAGSATTPRSAGGLSYFLSASADNINTNIAGAFNETAFKSTMLEVAKRGGTPNALICSVDVKNIINGFNNSATRTDRGDRGAGTLVDYYEGEGVGRIAIIADPSLRNAFGEAYLVDTRQMGKTWFADDMLRFEQEPANSRTIKETLQGQVSFTYKNLATHFARFYGIS